MVIFHSYVSLPEGISSQNDEQSPNIPILMIFKNMFFFCVFAWWYSWECNGYFMENGDITNICIQIYIYILIYIMLPSGYLT